MQVNNNSEKSNSRGYRNQTSKRQEKIIFYKFSETACFYSFTIPSNFHFSDSCPVFTII